MIQAVTTPAHKQAFATAIQGAPYFRAVMGRDLALWADNPGAPVRLFTLPGAALTLNGSTAQLCGTPQDWEELLSFLQFAGIAHLIAEETPLLPAAAGEPLFLYSMPPQDRLPLAQEHQGYMLNRSPSVLRLATQLFPQEPERQDCYYSETCTALAHGFARVLALQDAAGRPVSTVGAYAMANGEAYMAMGETLPELRGQGIGGWLTGLLAADLAARGRRVALSCKKERLNFYHRLGFAAEDTVQRYALDGLPEEK